MFDFPLEICNLFCQSQLLAVWKPLRRRNSSSKNLGIFCLEVRCILERAMRWLRCSQEQLMACSQTEFSLATETVEGLENEEFQEKLDEEEKNKSPKTFPLCTSARREHGEENNNKKKTNGEELIYFKLFSWHQARMLLPRAAKQLWLRCLLGKRGISMQTGQAPVSPPLLLAVASGAANPSLLPPESCFLSCPPGRNNLAEALLGFPSQAL